MKLDSVIFAVAGAMILASLLLAHVISPQFLWLTAFVGANMLQAAFTGFCPVAMLLRRLGVQPGRAFN